MANFSSFTDPDPASAMRIGIMYAIYAAIGIPANLLVLFLTITTESIRVIPLNMIIFCLAFSDMMLLISLLSSTFWAITNNILICKVMGVGIYDFIIMSLILPPCLAVCRYAAVHDEFDLHPFQRPFQTRKGILKVIAILWTYGLTFTLPFIITDKFGLDAIGCCGITDINSVVLWVYYMVFVVGVIFASYAVTFIFYRKLARWVQETSSMISMSIQTRETLVITRNLMRMIKWLLFFPVVVYYPALFCQALLRIFPDIISVHTARFFMITVPLPHVFDPIFTMIFVKRYRLALSSLLFRRSVKPTLVYPTNDETHK